MNNNICIVVVAGGHVFVGQLEDRNTESITLSPARQINRLGTADLVGGLQDGPTPQTTLMAPIRSLRIPVGQVRFDSQVRGWAKSLGVSDD